MKIELLKTLIKNCTTTILLSILEYSLVYLFGKILPKSPPKLLYIFSNTYPKLPKPNQTRRKIISDVINDIGLLKDREPEIGTGIFTKKEDNYNINDFIIRSLDRNEVVTKLCQLHLKMGACPTRIAKIKYQTSFDLTFYFRKIKL